MIDEKYIKLAIEIILEYKKVSATFLQRELNIGFAMADKIVDELENRGIIGPQVGAKPREIYFDNIKIKG